MHNRRGCYRPYDGHPHAGLIAVNRIRRQLRDVMLTDYELADDQLHHRVTVFT